MNDYTPGLEQLDEDQLEASMFPIDFFIEGTPKSLQANTKSKQNWKSTVTQAATERRAELVEFPWLDDQPLALTIYYFPSSQMPGDIDNIVKPIMDALIGIVYRDDNCVERVTAQKFEPGILWEFTDPSEQLISAMAATDKIEYRSPVVYLHVSNDLSWRTI